jgi:hypothetical protein
MKLTREMKGNGSTGRFSSWMIGTAVTVTAGSLATIVSVIIAVKSSAPSGNRPAVETVPPISHVLTAEAPPPDRLTSFSRVVEVAASNNTDTHTLTVNGRLSSIPPNVTFWLLESMTLAQNNKGGTIDGHGADSLYHPTRLTLDSNGMFKVSQQYNAPNGIAVNYQLVQAAAGGTDLLLAREPTGFPLDDFWVRALAILSNVSVSVRP